MRRFAALVGLVGLALLGLAAGELLEQAGRSSRAVVIAAAPTGDPGHWHGIFDEEFGAGSLDTAVWSTGWFGAGITGPINPDDELSCYDPAEVTQANGILDLGIVARAETCPTAAGMIAKPYATGFISTRGRFSFTHGFLEARIWLPPTPSGQIADWPAFWAVGRGPADGELDVVEGLGGLACWHFHAPAGVTGNCSAATFAGGWHTFGADWEPGNVTWYYDGRPVGSVSSGITSSPLFLILDLSVDHANGGPIEAPAHLRVDYVRVWQH